MASSNIKFVGRDEIDKETGKLIRRNDPIECIINAGVEILLPKATEQKKKGKGFFHKNADTIVRLFPHLYKAIKKRG